MSSAARLACMLLTTWSFAACSSHDAAPLDASDETCGELATLQECFQCCGTAHVDGATLYAQLTHDCTCRPDVCATPCAASFCAGHEPASGDACDLCVRDAFAEAGPVACRTSLSMACDADEECAQYAACLPRCSGKP